MGETLLERENNRLGAHHPRWRMAFSPRSISLDSSQALMFVLYSHWQLSVCVKCVVTKDQNSAYQFLSRPPREC